MRRMLLLLALVIPCFAGGEPASAQGRARVVNVYNWSDYIDPTVIDEFTKSTGITVRYDTFDSNDTLAAALHYLGLDPNTTREGDYQKAAELVSAIRPSVRKFHSSEYLNALASGEICFVVGFSGDIKQAQKRAAEARNGIEVAYSIPKEGAQLWFDNLAIPRDARNVAEAHAFIDYLQKPEVAAKNSNVVAYANGNLASQKFIDKAVLEDRTIYPDEATMSRLYTMNAHDAKTTRLMNRLWTRIKTGR